MSLTSQRIQQLAFACGFEIAGITPATPHSDFSRFQSWCRSGSAAGMSYLTDHRADLRSDPRNLLPNARHIVCLGKLYNTDQPFSTQHMPEVEGKQKVAGWISRYAWGSDYHNVLRHCLETLVQKLTEANGSPFKSKICIDTAPLLERSYARAAGLGWIGKNTCLINQQHGSWFFLAELLVDLGLVPTEPVADRCGSCTRCIDACPTAAIVPHANGGYQVDARLCISYLTIEERGSVPSRLAAQQGSHIFGCDICQDVCPWNLRAHRSGFDLTTEPTFAAQLFAPDLAQFADFTDDDFHRTFRHTPIWRSKYEGFLRNVAIAMGNSGSDSMHDPLTKLSQHPNRLVAQTAQESLARLAAIGW